MAQQKVKYGYMAVEITRTATGEPTTTMLQAMNKLGDGDFVLLRFSTCRPNKHSFLWSNSGTP